MPEGYWWIWMIVAVVFIIGEIFTPAFFLLWFGVGAAVAGVMGLLGVGATWQIAAFVVISFVLFVASRRFADRVTKEQPPGIGADRFIGKEALVLEEINNAENTGRVRMDREEWRAESEGGDVIREGARVEVINVDGTHLVVRAEKED